LDFGQMAVMVGSHILYSYFHVIIHMSFLISLISLMCSSFYLSFYKYSVISDFCHVTKGQECITFSLTCGCPYGFL
jgi:hypothetical protein